MTRIYKYVLRGGETVHQVPEGARALTAQYQHGSICLWLLVDPRCRPEPRTFHLYGTGHDIENGENLRYIATVQECGGHLVWHIFEESSK